MQLNVEKKEEKPVIRTQNLSLKEESKLKERLALLEDIRDEKEIMQGVSYESKNPQDILDEIEKIKNELEKRSVRPAVGNDRSDVVRELKILEEDLRKGMPDWNTFISTKRSDGIAYVKLVRQIMKNDNDPLRRRKIERWKFLRRRLDPTDPYIADTMYLFEGTKE